MESRKFKMVGRASGKELRHEVLVKDEGFGGYNVYMVDGEKTTFICSRISEAKAVSSARKFAEGFCIACDLVEEL